MRRRRWKPWRLSWKTDEYFPHLIDFLSGFLYDRCGFAGMVELADTQDLGSCAERHVGSSPTTRTKNQQTVVLQRFAYFCFPLILFLYRSAAICSMQIRDVNLNTGTISYRQIKNKSVQIVPLCSERTIIFLEYLHIREGQPQEYLLSDDSGSMMTESRPRYAI